MKTFKHLLLTAMVFLVLTIPLGTALCANASRVVLKNGTVYEGVEFSIDKQYKVLVIEIEGGKKNVSFSDVAAIYDDNGNDITSGYIERHGVSNIQEDGVRVATAYVRKHFVEVGMGITISSDYHDAVENAVGPISGGYGMINMEVGLGICAARQLHIVPKLRLLAGRVVTRYVDMPGVESSSANIVFVPGVAARYELVGRSVSFYAAGDLGLVSPHSDLTNLKLESGGIAAGLVAGIVFAEDYQIEVGYIRVPVDVMTSRYDYYYYDDYYDSRASNTANFGGPILNLKRLFRF